MPETAAAGEAVIDAVEPVRWPLDDAQRAGIERTLAQLKEVGEAIGGWTGKADVRMTGASYHVKFANKVDVMGVGMHFIAVLENAPSMLSDAIERLLLADDEHRTAKSGGGDEGPDAAAMPAETTETAGEVQDQTIPAGTGPEPTPTVQGQGDEGSTAVAAPDGPAPTSRDQFGDRPSEWCHRGVCCGPGSWCCQRAGLHYHDDVDPPQWVGHPPRVVS